MSRTAPTIWTTLPAMHHRHPKMVYLLDTHGASGPHTFTVLLAEAAARIGERGVVKLAWSDFARFADIEPTREAVLERLEGLATLGLVEVVSDAPHGFTVRLPNWDDWDLVPKTTAERQATHRSRASESGERAKSAPEPA
jgi:hypothetical protein